MDTYVCLVNQANRIYIYSESSEPSSRSSEVLEILGSQTDPLRFEIYVGEDLVWSTMARQRHPNLQDRPMVHGWGILGR